MKTIFYILSVLSLNIICATADTNEQLPAATNQKIERVFGSSPPMNYLIYALNPNKMIGLNFNARNPFNKANDFLLDEKFLSLPVIGSFHGGGVGINLETLLERDPQLILIWEDDMMVQTIKERVAKTHLPTLVVPFRNTIDMANSIRKVGDAIGEKERGELLASYIEKSIGEVKSKIQDTTPTKYYYAEGIDGLSTECDTSFHVEAINFAGGENVHKCKQTRLLGLEKISFETLMVYDPDIIFVQTKIAYDEIHIDSMWQNLKAVKNNKVYLVPAQPFNWIDRPPSFMKAMGIQWLASKLHPDVYDIDMRQHAKEFYKLFFNVELDDKQIDTILGEKQ